MFIDEVLDIGPAYGWQFGPASQVRVLALRSGMESREILQDQMRHSFTLPFAKIRTADYLAKLKAAFAVCHGPGHSFKVRDWSDYAVTAETLGTAPSGSAPVQLRKTYAFGGQTLVRPITKPDAASVVITQAGTPKAGTVDPLTGLFTPSTAWTAGAALAWSGQFWVPVRFASDQMLMSIPSNYGADGFAVTGSVDLIEVFGE